MTSPSPPEPPNSPWAKILSRLAPSGAAPRPANDGPPSPPGCHGGPDVGSAMAAFLYEEMADAALWRLKQFIPRLPPSTRLRLLAFVHQLEHPEDLTADLAVEASGVLRLTLATVETGQASIGK